MTPNPLLNAAAAEAYIVAITQVIQYLTRAVPGPDTFMIPIFMLSLFVLSAAVMGYLFLLEPLRLYLSGKHNEGIALFLKTVGVFFVFTIAAFGLLILAS